MINYYFLTVILISLLAKVSESKSHYFADEIYDIQSYHKMTLLFLHFAKESSEVCLQRNFNPEGTCLQGNG